jgi:hypothetical protein
MLTVTKAGATPNLLKYRVSADSEGGSLVLDHAALLRDAAQGPLKNFIQKQANLKDATQACERLLCNPSTRVFVTPRALARIAVDAIVDEKSAIGLRFDAEPGAEAIVALEFRHSMAV